MLNANHILSFQHYFYIVYIIMPSFHQGAENNMYVLIHFSEKPY